MKIAEQRLLFVAAMIVACGVFFRGTPVMAQPPSPYAQPQISATGPDHRGVLQGPMLSVDEGAARLPRAQPEVADRPLPINLATALRLAGSRPVIINAAQASVQVAEAELKKAIVQWLPSINAGAGYYGHDGATQGQSGNFYNNSKNEFFAGAGLTAKVSTADALYAPLVARQVLRSREINVQTARNDALLATAEAYFDVQQARGRLAAFQNVVDRSLALGKAIDVDRAGQGTRTTDLHRAKALLAGFEEDAATAREQWGLASADLTRVLRLDPAAVVVPTEPPNLHVTLIAPELSVDFLIPIGLTSRPELASQQTLVQAALTRIRQERMRPLMPSLILQGSPGASGPGNYLMGGVFASGVDGTAHPTQPRVDVSVGVVWEMQNLGFGNHAMVRERQSQQQQTLVELFRIQDMVAAEIARAHVQVKSANTRIASGERGLRESTLAFEGSVAELGKLEKTAEVTIVVRRTFEVIDALKSLSRAYDVYFGSINDFNRAQFRLYRALGYPAEILTCERETGPVLPVDTSRPPGMAPVCAPDLAPRPR